MVQAARSALTVRRFAENPIIRPDMDARMGANINGPSLIRVPDWLPDPLGRYYLYFAHHQGDYIRLAYADGLAGPWRIHAPGTLGLAGSFFDDHIASPDVHVDDERREIRMYYHGKMKAAPAQYSRLALSTNGIDFVAREEVLGAPYLRVVRRGDGYLALAMPGHLYRSRDGLTAFEQGPTLFTRNMRHSALLPDGDTLTVFYTNVGETPPERILVSRIDLRGDWTAWQPSPPEVVLEPEHEYEGADLPLAPSVRGISHPRMRELRDPAIYREDGRTYLLYTVAGESGIAIAELGRPAAGA
jgi:hypothetical protein